MEVADTLLLLLNSNTIAATSILLESQRRKSQWPGA